jgi:hypothetical protein
MEHLKEFLKTMKFNSKEIETLLDETKVDEQTDIITGWDARYSQVVGEKLKPIIETELKEANTQEIFNKQKEAIRKTRKSINTTLALGLTAKQLDEMTDDDFNSSVKEHSTKETSTKLTDLEAQYKEENRLRLEAESKLTDEVNKVKKEFADKDIQREIELEKARLIAAKDSAKFDKSDMELIDYAIEGGIMKQGVSFISENGKLLAIGKDGQKIRNGANEFVEYKELVDGIITPKFEIKTRATPEGGGADGGEGQKTYTKSQREIDMEKSYKSKNINTVDTNA